MRRRRISAPASWPCWRACATRASRRISSPTAHSTSGRASPSARKPSSMRTVRAVSPASMASRSPKTS
ncbi:Uncharacterised protein [Bordetella pertussis]|nr:Uncharacterised protein [Bordetella pertussis]